MSKSFDELRVQYPVFRFEKYTIMCDENFLKLVFHFSIDGLCSFFPCWIIPVSHYIDTQDLALQRLVFSLGMTELVSYWKITCSPKIQIECGALQPEQCEWWKKLYFGGLGEFFYKNEIKVSFGNFVAITSSHACVSVEPSQKRLFGKLIPVGGGKDSIVTLNLLKSELDDACVYLINHRDSSVCAAQLAGIPNERIYEVSRTIDPNLLSCNAKGFLNGHTPFSAIVAFSSILTAYINGLKTVILSNESSASEATVSLPDEEINHQYSKSYLFEQEFMQYESCFLRTGVQYFSLLRPLTEFQIARYFSTLSRDFHTCFRSCNAGAKTDSWCGHCAKCLFVAIILSPFLPYCEISSLLGADIFNQVEMLPVLEELTGRRPNKPFECVGSRKEVNYALCLTIDMMLRAHEPLPFLLEQYRTRQFTSTMLAEAKQYGMEFDKENGLSSKYEKLIKEQCIFPFASK